MEPQLFLLHGSPTLPRGTFCHVQKHGSAIEQLQLLEHPLVHIQSLSQQKFCKF
jgi:hypothetical protein